MRPQRACCPLVFGALVALGCGPPPECIEGPSNLTPEALSPCAPLGEGVALDDQIYSAGALQTPEGGVHLTWSSLGLRCGTLSRDFFGAPPDPCWTEGWILALELPRELVFDGSTIVMEEHPELIGDFRFTGEHGGTASSSQGDRPVYVGVLELTHVRDACITGSLEHFGTGYLNPLLGGPELHGGFLAPRCHGEE